MSAAAGCRPHRPGFDSQCRGYCYAKAGMWLPVRFRPALTLLCAYNVMGGWMGNEFDVRPEKLSPGIIHVMNRLDESLGLFKHDPADTEYQRGYEAALMEFRARLESELPK